MVSLALYGVAGLAPIALSSLVGVLVCRAGLGLAVGGILTVATTLVTDYYDGERRSAVLGQQAAAMGAGGVVFLLLGGVLADVSWRAPFAIYAAALVALPAALAFLDEPDRTPATDAPDAAPLPVALAVTVYALAFVGMIVFYLTPVQIPFYLAERGVPSGTLAGGAIALATVASVVTSLRFQRVLQRLGYRGTVAVVFAAFAAGYAAVALGGTLTGAAALVPVGLGMLAVGAGAGLLMPALNNWLGDQTPAAARGRALGGLSTALFFGQFVSPIAAQPVTDAATLAASFAAAAGLSVAVAAVLAVRARRSPDPVPT